MTSPKIYNVNQEFIEDMVSYDDPAFYFINAGGSIIKDPEFLYNKIELSKNLKKGNLRKSNQKQNGQTLMPVSNSE